MLNCFKCFDTNRSQLALGIKGANTCCGKEGYFFLSDAILQRNVKWVSVDWTHSHSYLRKKRRGILILLLALSVL